MPLLKSERSDPNLASQRQVDSTLWRYRVGPFRLICTIEDETFVVLVHRVGDRREFYDR